MTRDRRNFLIVLAAVVAVVVALLLAPQVERKLAPRLRTAWVAIEPEGSETAVVGGVKLPAGTPFRLHAVLEAQRRDGSKIYYSEAPALRFGDRPVAPEDLVPWDRPEEVKVLWFTVEGSIPYLELSADRTLESFRMTEFLRADWPQTWSIPGSLDPSNDDALVRRGARGSNPFGTQRYHVRIELYDRGSRLIPVERYTSPDAAAALAEDGDFPTVFESLPGPIGPASTLFGLTQIEPPAGAGGELLRKIQVLTRRHLAFSRVTALEALLRHAGRRTQELEWRLVSLDGRLRWNEPGGVAPGNLLRVGDRVVVLYLDEGEPGALDRGDLCFDFAHGAAVRPLTDVFIGGGEVELASLEPASEP